MLGATRGLTLILRKMEHRFEEVVRRMHHCIRHVSVDIKVEQPLQVVGCVASRHGESDKIYHDNAVINCLGISKLLRRSL
jgi:hypothetical protein